MEITVIRLDPNGLCDHCQKLPISGQILDPKTNDRETPAMFIGCSECVGEKVKSLL